MKFNMKAKKFLFIISTIFIIANILGKIDHDFRIFAQDEASESSQSTSESIKDIKSIIKKRLV